MNEDPKTVAEADIVVVPDGRCWAVLDLHRRDAEDERPRLPDILYSGLEAREGAEMARREAIGQLLDTGAVYGPSEVPIEFFDMAGRLLAFLRNRMTPDAENLAVALASDAPWLSRPASDAFDPQMIPF